MSLQREIYKELEDILGSENISEDPAVLHGYTRAAFSEVYTGKLFLDLPEAVVLPKSTEDIQSIVKLCNRRRLKFKAFSTGYGPWALPGSEGVIILDLRRMNRIIEIDERNMYIVVEPYVSSGQAQAEVMKSGLNCVQLPGGSQCSLLAAHTSMDGRSTQSLTVTHASRNLLGVEWITPTGDIVRLGSLGSGAGWFSGDGPGPSLRGIIRGTMGAQGGLGIFTKCAVKLYPWPGPPVLETEGILPDYELEIPPLFEYRLVHFPDWEHFADAAYKICEAKIAYNMEKIGSSERQLISTTSNDEFWAKLQAGEMEIPRICLGILLAANSPGEHEYQVKVLDKILDETMGLPVQLKDNDTFRKHDYLQLIRPGFIGRDTFRPTGSSVDFMMGSQDTIDDAIRAAKAYEEIIDKLLESHQFFADNDDCRLGFYEQGLYAYWESHLKYDPADQKSIEAAAKSVETGVGTTIQNQFAPVMLGGALAQMLGPMIGNLHIWLRKIKKAFDPNNLSDPSWYISGEE